MNQISISIVSFNNNCEMLEKIFQSCLNLNLEINITCVDNSKNDNIKNLCDKMHIEYFATGKNIGFGSAHNIVIKKNIDLAQYHLILNPDIYFRNGVLEKIFDFAKKNKEVGLIMPKVLYPDGSLQYLCKLLPNPVDFLIRRFLPLLPNSFKRKNELYELRFSGYDKIMEAPFLSGCFMFIQNEVFKKIGFFDEQFFMYLEDVDLCRRIKKYFKIIYYPEAVIYHECERGSTKNYRLLRYHIFSSIKYFNKWGWFFDKERNRINSQTLERLESDKKIKND